jgi:hypothetical protein
VRECLVDVLCGDAVFVRQRPCLGQHQVVTKSARDDGGNQRLGTARDGVEISGFVEYRPERPAQRQAIEAVYNAREGSLARGSAERRGLAVACFKP